MILYINVNYNDCHKRKTMHAFFIYTKRKKFQTFLYTKAPDTFQKVRQFMLHFYSQKARHFPLHDFS